LALVDPGEKINGCDGVLACFSKEFRIFDVLIFECPICVIDDVLSKISSLILVNWHHRLILVVAVVLVLLVGHHVVLAVEICVLKW